MSQPRIRLTIGIVFELAEAVFATFWVAPKGRP